MDRSELKILLGSYRSQDAGDPLFAEALREVASDPELAPWFEEAQRFDTVVGEKLRDAPVPADVKGRILSGGRQSSVPALRRWWRIPVAIAATIAVAALLWQNFAPVPRSHALAMQAISFTDDLPALQFVCFNAAEVANWVNKQPTARTIGLTLSNPGETANMRMIGSSVVDWHGRPAVMICLQHEGRMAMLYILSDADAAALPEGANETIEERGWAVRTTKSGGQVRLLTARGRAEDLEFPVPF